jgi:8-oxo-dGTP pyrophosphatase MutT (NUDIX family)
MARTPIPTWFFVLVVVRQEDRFLLVHERKHGQLWYFPAGRVEPGESLAAAAYRETLEEAGVRVQLDGVLRVEHQLVPGGARVRVLYTARPLDDTPPKQQPDEESLGAAWVRLEDLARLPLRSDEVARVLTEIRQGAPIYPLSIIGLEGSSLLA